MLSTEQVATLRGLIARGWDASTSADPQGWSPGNPSWGQCAVTSLLVQRHLGGELLRTEVNGISHYFNRLPDGQVIDLTFDQFPAGSRYGEVALRPRSYVEGFPATARRYETLVARVGAEVAAFAHSLQREMVVA